MIQARSRPTWRAAPALCALAIAFLAAPQAASAPAHGIAMHGAPALEPDFDHLPYADPQAPAGGRITFSSIGTFDNLNPFIVRGVTPSTVRDYVFESLLARNFDEPFSLYGLLAETVETPDDRSSVTFTLRQGARFSDGRPVGVEDVVFSLETLREFGRPNHRSYYSKVAGVERPAERAVRFVFEGGTDREMPLIMGLMPILPRHVFDEREFDRTTLEPLIGSGPYVVDAVDPGASITYRRDEDYWGGDLAINRGRFNFAEIRHDFYRDASTRFEAFTKGLYDFQQEWDPARWATGYDIPALDDGRIVKEQIARGTPAGMLGLAFNTRREIFADKRVRDALIAMFDFEWLNANLFHGLYARTQGYFDGSELSSLGRPASQDELALLEPYSGAVDPVVLDGTYELARTDASGRNREQIRAALGLLGEAGYEIRDGVLVNGETGAPFAFEIMVAERRQERYALAYAKALERIGIAVRVRQVDSAQYQERRQTYDFDMVEHFWYASLSPGNEQQFYWSSESATTEGTRNYMGAREPAIDAMIEALLAARGRDDFVSAVRALDRVLISGSYVIPLFHWPAQWIARWARVDHPERHSIDGYKVDTWWASESDEQ